MERPHLLGQRPLQGRRPHTGGHRLDDERSVGRAAHPRFDGATNPVDRKPSRANHATGLIFQLRKAKEKNSVALDKFRESGTTVTPTIDHSLLDEVLAGK